MRANARSSERNPANWRGASASTTPATVTSGRSCPFATIWVPSRIAAPGWANSASRRATAPRPEALEPSIRTSRAERHEAREGGLDPLRAHPLTRDVGAVTGGADARHRLLVAAVVAGQAPRVLVLHQGDIAVGAAGDPAAVAAQRHQREAPAAGQHDRLLPAQGGRVERRGQGARHRARALGAHVDDLDRGQRRAVGALGQGAARQGVPRLRAGRRAAVDHRRTRPGAPAAPPPAGRRSAARSPACTSHRAPRPPPPGRGAPPGRTRRCARRAPRRRRPSRTRRCSAARWAGVSAECQIAMSSPSRARRRPSSWGVSAISGTNTRLPRPRARAASIARRYTSVLPDPVTPWTSSAPPPAVHQALDLAHGRRPGLGSTPEECRPAGRRPPPRRGRRPDPRARRRRVDRPRLGQGAQRGHGGARLAAERGGRAAPRPTAPARPAPRAGAA